MEEIKTDSIKKHWYTEINILRGILVVLVVVGHIVLQVDVEDSGIREVYRVIGKFIYSFHMPAFFAISGFLGYKALREVNPNTTFGAFAKSKFFRLIVPYFAMGLIYLPFRLLLQSIARTEFAVKDVWKILIGNNPDGALWYLYVLFMISLLVFLLMKKDALYVAFGISCVFYLGNLLIPWPKDFVIDKMLSSFCFYLLGMICHYNYENVKIILNKTIVELGTICGFIGLNIALLVWSCEWVKFFTSISGTALCFMLAVRIDSSSSLLNRFLNAMGDYGMDIYIFSEPIKVVFRTILRKMKIPTGISELLLLIIVVSVSYYGSKLIVRKIKPMRMILLGMKN